MICVYKPIFYFKKPILPQELIFWVNFIRILWFIWDLVLVLFDIHKDVVSGKILVFSNILGFPGVNWAQKWTKTFNFGYVLFPLKHLILKDCLETVFVLWDTTYRWSKFQQTCAIFRGERAEKTTVLERIVPWMLHRHENILTFIPWQPQMLN